MTTAGLPCDQVEVLLQIIDPAVWEMPGAAWDRSAWDDIFPFVWQDDLAGYHQCNDFVRGFVLERGRQQDWDDILAGKVDIELDNSSGLFSVYGPNAFPRIRMGLGVRIYATWDDVRYPLFVGSLSSWNEVALPGDNTIFLHATDYSRQMAEPIDIEYNPGTPAERVAYRIERLLTAGGFRGHRNIAVGDATMTNYLTTRSLIDEVKVTAMSDGGLFFFDNDGTATYLDQSRVFGRPRLDDSDVPLFGDGCFETPHELPYAAIDPRLADNEFGNVVTVSNVSQGTDSPFSAKAVNLESIRVNGRYFWSPSQLVICNANYVQALADFQVKRRSIAYYRIDNFTCYPAHDDGLWPVLLSLRIGDAIRVRRRAPESPVVDVPMLCDGMRIEATPDVWKFIVRCSPAASNIETASFWDYDLWDIGLWS